MFRLFTAAILIVFPVLALAAMTPAQRAAILAPTTNFSEAETWEDLPGGSATNRKRFGREAFSQPSGNLSFEDRGTFFIGNGVFRRAWVIAPSSTQSADGLGPLYNARGCQRCHLKDGRGHPPAGPDDSAVSMFLRLSIPPQDKAQEELLSSRRASVIPEPTYGGQLHDLAVPGVKPEGRMVITYGERPVELAGGEIAQLRVPAYSVGEPGYGPLHPDAMLSPRVTPAMIGLGLLEAIEDADILAGADPEDADGDGISGRPNRVWSLEHNKVMLGRFGWKAGQASLMDQSAGAFAGDIGISSPLAPDPWGDCTAAQTDCRDAPHGGSLDAPAEVMDLLLFYVRNLAVPARKDPGAPEVLRGKALFYGAGCTGCHRPKFAIGRDYAVPALAGQLIWPYTDMLLHDMGEGLADKRPEGEASGSEWRTPPLWGIGYTQAVSDHTYFLHDGRARNLTEAILWHGGEAQAARDTFVSMPKEDRAALLAFLNSL
jgi:CxxC motif-containing protein (DUF1111 family)